jgi:DNA-binding IclR family transcriptional regulator
VLEFNLNVEYLFHNKNNSQVGEFKMEDNQVAVLQKALNIFETLAAQGGPQPLNHLSKATGVGLTTAYRILATLQDRHVVAKDADNRYAVAEFTQYVFGRNNYHSLIREAAYEPMRETSSAESLAINLIVRNYEKCFILQQVRTGKALEYLPPVGTELPIYASGGGKVLLAALPPILLQEILQTIELKPFTKRTLTKKIDLMQELEEVKVNGYALDVYESVEQGYCIAVPVRHHDGAVIASLSFSGFIGDFDDADLGHYCQVLGATAQKITQSLGG